MKLILLSAILLLAACDATSPSSLPPNVQLGADAITARQTSDAAMARTNALSAQATAVKQSTRDAQDARATDAGIQLAFTNVTATAAMEKQKRADVGKTESAIAGATYMAASATHVAQTQVAIAAQTSTRVVELAATATATAYVPTQVYIEQQQQADYDRRMRERELADARYQQEMLMVPFVRTLELITPMCSFLLVFGALGVVIIGLGRAGKRWIESQTLKVQSDALKQLTAITDRAGNPIGYLKPVSGSFEFEPIEYEEFEVEPAEVKPIAPIIRANSSEAPKAIAAPAEPLIGDFVYPSTLRAFTQAILEENDWTQGRWREKVLPRGYVMSMDTRDSNGNHIPGGYSRLIQLYEDNNLIINRRAGTTGEWNPNAPRDVEKVLDILENKAPLPEVQEVKPPEPKPSPTPPKRRAKKAAAQLG